MPLAMQAKSSKIKQRTVHPLSCALALFIHPSSHPFYQTIKPIQSHKLHPPTHQKNPIIQLIYSGSSYPFLLLSSSRVVTVLSLSLHLLPKAGLSLLLLLLSFSLFLLLSLSGDRWALPGSWPVLSAVTAMLTLRFLYSGLCGLPTSCSSFPTFSSVRAWKEPSSLPSELGARLTISPGPAAAMTNFSSLKAVAFSSAFSRFPARSPSDSGPGSVS